MDKVIDITAVRGIPTPRFPVQMAKQDLDPELFVKMLAEHPGHNERLKELRERHYATIRLQEAAEEQERTAWQERLKRMGVACAVLGCVTLWALFMVGLLL